MSQSERCVLYARKSTDREDKQILSILAQLAELQRFAARENLAITEQIVEHHSAREPGRPAFSRLLTDIADGKVTRVLAWKLDRLARNPIDGGALIHYLGKGLLKELVTPEGRYSGAGDSKFMLSVLFGAATKMTDDLAVGVKRGNRAIHERGRITGIPPLGYMKVRDNPGYRGAGKVVPDPERFEVIKRVWREALAGETASALWRKATQKWGLTMRATRNQPSRLPSVNYMYNVLSNRFYAGQIERCGEVFQGEHEPMVTLAEFERVQRNLHRPDCPRPRRNDFLYRGLLRCGACGRLLTGEQHKGQYVYYRCGRRRAGRPQCTEPGPSERQVTSAVENSLEQITLPADLIEWTLQAVDVWVEHQVDARYSEVSAHKQELEDLRRQLERLTDLVVAGTLAETDYIDRKSRLLERRKLVERLISEPVAMDEAWKVEMRAVLRASSEFSAGFRNGTHERRRELLQHVYANCVVQGRIVTPVARFPYAAFLEGRPDSSFVSGGYANYPSPQDVVLKRKNARPRDDRERAFLTWWTEILQTRTELEQFGSLNRDHCWL